MITTRIMTFILVASAITTACAQEGGLCLTVAEGAVGDDSIAELRHIVDDDGTEVNMVLRLGEENLCESHAAVGLLYTKTNELMHGLFPHVPHIQTNALPGNEVVAVVMEVLVDEDIQCIVHGSLSFTLEQCHLE